MLHAVTLNGAVGRGQPPRPIPTDRQEEAIASYGFHHNMGVVIGLAKQDGATICRLVSSVHSHAEDLRPA
jgi:hypothetical protein